MEQHYWWCALLFRLILPLIITVAAFIRPTVTSYVYMILGCYVPFFSVPTERTMARSTGTFMKILVISCVLTTLLVVSFYFAIIFPADAQHEIKPCSTLEVIMRTIGIIEFRELGFTDAIAWCLPEPLMLTTSVVLYVAFKKLNKETRVKRAAAEMEGKEMSKMVDRRKIITTMLSFAKYFLVFLLCCTAVIKGTVLGYLYYFLFLAIMTYWACNQALEKAYARVLVLVIPITFLNITILFWYQFQYFIDSPHFDPESLWGRLFYLIEIKTYKDCTDPRVFTFHKQTTTAYVMIVTRFFLYHLAVLVARAILEAKDGFYNLIVALFAWEKKSRLSWQRAFSIIRQQREEELVLTPTVTVMNNLKHIVENVLHFIMSSSYLLANFAMMIWAISYVTWKTVILLIWANLIWLMPFRKKVMLATSPLLVVWVWFLLGTSYFYSLNLTDEELPPELGMFNLQSGILREDENEWIHMLLKSLYGVIIFAAMRQLFQERDFKRHQRRMELDPELAGLEAAQKLEDEQRKNKYLERVQPVFARFFALWWIWMVIFMMIWLEFWAISNMFRIAFVALAIVFIMTFQLCPFDCWKKFLSIYWWIVIVYAMINLFVVYMYQITATRSLLHKYIASEQAFHQYGFRVWTDRKERLMTLASPLFFQIAVVVQQNYFQKAFNELTSPKLLEEIQRMEKELAESDTAWAKVKIAFSNALSVIFEILEVHMQNIVLLVGWFMCLFDMCAFFVPFVLLFTASCVFGRIFTNIVLYVVSCFVQVLILVRLVYMNQYTQHKKWNYVGQYTRNELAVNKTLNSADWLGLHESPLGKDHADFWQLHWCFFYVFAVTIRRVVSIRLANYRLSRNLPLAQRRVLFPDITFENCHENITTMLKYLANYGFYKFGCELTAVFASILMGLRMDAIAIVMSIWLFIMFSLNRTWLRVLWLITLVISAFAVPLQYVATLGAWPTYWKYSLASFWSSNDFLLRIQQFCHLPNMAHPPIKEKICLDFLFLLMVSSQWRAFRAEWKFRGQHSLAGGNEDVSSLIESTTDVENPVPDFVTYTRSYLDVFKRIFFTCWFYLALASAFLAGTARVTWYSFGYILGAFMFLWQGTELFLRPPKTILRKWNLLIAYTILVMMTRTVTQVFGCILQYEKGIYINCAIYRTFTLGCVDKFDMTSGVPNLSTTSTCVVSYDALGLGYDCLCFFFLIFQQRIFKSYHFFHMVNDTKAQTILANRGAGLIEDKKHKKREALDAQDALIRDNIRRKVDRIRATHQRVQGDVYTRRKKNSRQLKKSSDYYLFDEANLSNDVPLLPPKKEEEDSSEFNPYDPMPLTEFFGLLHATNIPTVLEERTLRQQQKAALREGKRPESSKTYSLLPKSPQPSTSRDLPAFPAAAAEASELSGSRKVLNMITLVWSAFESTIVTLTGLLNRSTKDFRSILNDMHRDRITLKEKTEYAQGVRLGSNKIWQPASSYQDVLNAAAIITRSKGKVTDPETIQFSIYFKLLRAIGFLLSSQSEWICYWAIIVNQVLSASFTSLPLVLLMFCWGALTVPKPTKTFWIVSIAYVLIMLFIHLFSVTDIVPWNEKMEVHRSNLFFPPYVLGTSSLSRLTLDIAVLVSLFFHRTVLQMLGLWKLVIYRTGTLINDGSYIFKDGTFVPLPPGDKSRNPQALMVDSTKVSIGDYFPRSVIHGLTKYAEGSRLFIQQLVFPSSTQIPVDVYTPMFLCDLVNLFLIVFFYGSFASEEEDAGFVKFIENNRVPISFIVVVLLYFLLIVVDRGIYLRKNRFHKIVYFFFQVLCVHIWCFVLYPMLTTRYFCEVRVVQVFYVLKCTYFLFSAYQIRNGYPSLISCHFLWHDTTLFNRFGYKLYRLIPYFFELRSLLDWICSDSCLSVSDWFKMEEITQNVFDQKCEQDFDERWGDPGGQARNRTVKYAFGGVLYALLILTVIFPFLLFSLGGTVGVKTHPGKIKLELYMGSAEPIFQSYASERNLISFSQGNYYNLTQTFNNIPASEAIFGNFQAEDVVAVTWSPHSLTKWKVSPGTFKELMDELLSNETFVVRVEIHYTHIGHGGMKEQKSFGQNAQVPPLPNEQRQQLIDILQANVTLKQAAWLPLVFPKFLMITKEAVPRVLPIMGEPSDVHYEEYVQETVDGYFYEDDDDDVAPDPKLLRNLLVSLQYSENGDMWWYLEEECTSEDDNYFYYLKDLVHNSCDYLVMYTFNEKVFSDAISYITQSGILGLYLLYFMMVIGIIRGCRIDIEDIWIEDLPNSTYVMTKCMEVYVARDMQNYELEEELFAELIFIMRSREMLIKLTRYEDSPYNPAIVGLESKKTR